MSETIKIYPKLNIFLKILGHKDGFHQIHSRFVLAKGELYDEMNITHYSCFTLQGDFDCEEKDNLIYKAKCVLQDFLDIQGQKTAVKAIECVKIEVQKSIPKGAGLGGGSGNAGAFLIGVNNFFGLGLSQKQLMAVGEKIGADVAFFVSGEESANVSGKGQYIQSLNEKPLQYSIYTPPHIFCDTTKVYKCYADSIKAHKRSYSTPANEWFAKTSLELLSNHFSKSTLNDLYESACEIYPHLRDIAQELGEGWYFSGSGSSFFRQEQV